jgi:SAM-dependent methyltransferase
VEGVEPDPVSRGHAVEVLGLDVIGGTLEEAGFPDSSFDALTMSHVVEHLVDPVRTFAECRRVLKPGGQLVVLTPNIGSLGHRWFRDSWRGLEPPRHLFLFRRETLRTCAERAGLRVVKVWTTANVAPFIWQASSATRRAGTLPGGHLRHPPLSTQIGSWLFWVLESALVSVGAVGEEIVLVSTKPG